jgi:plastocyanin
MPSNFSHHWARKVNDRAYGRSISRLSAVVLLTAFIHVSCVESAVPDREVESRTIRIVGMQFEPAELIVKRGTRIVWINDDMFLHTVTATDRAFDSGSIAASASWTYLATQSSTHEYVCALHPTMKGRLIVL